jgi:hypothetical protein
VLVRSASARLHGLLGVAEPDAKATDGLYRVTSADSILALLATADIISIDGHHYAKSSRAAKVGDLDEVTTDDALLDLIAPDP